MSKKHPNFIKYMEYIVNHDNYKTQPCGFNKNNNITWVKTAKSCPERTLWWDSQVSKYSLKNRAEVARYLHPKELKGLKPCSECGKYLSIYYIYPGKNCLKKINDIFKTNYRLYEEGIYYIIDDLINKKIDINLIISNFIDIFKIKEGINSIDSLKSYLLNTHTHKSQKGKLLSPGVMSNAPDRFDGFHTYNACCRKEKDTGRYEENMKNYTRDRRAFEHWADGNFTLANQIMGEFLKYKKVIQCPGCKNFKQMTADHIGPISLGFCHREKFNPLCSSCNSSKNNRMTYENVQELIKDEEAGIQVISWHSKYIWDKLKKSITNNSEAKHVSSIMRKNMHYILATLNIIRKYKNGYDFLLTKLHPEYVKYKYKISNFSPLELEKIVIKKEISNAKTKNKSQERYIQISFEELEKYSQKDNRIYNDNLLSEYQEKFINIESLLIEKNFNKVTTILLSIFQDIANELEQKFRNS